MGKALNLRMLMSLPKGMDYELSHQADRFLKRLVKSNKSDVRRILDKIGEIIEDPYGFEYLRSDGKYRKARVGSYRVIFTIEEDGSLCLILLIDLRKNIYKQFNR